MLPDRIVVPDCPECSPTTTRRALLARTVSLGLAAPAFAALNAACRGGDETDRSEEPIETPGTTRQTPPAISTVIPHSTPTPDSESTDLPTPVPTGSPEPINVAVLTRDSGVGNPILAGANAQIAAYVFSRLLRCDDRGTLVPELAREWSFSDDQLTLSLTLNDALWHDGERFTVDDVIFTLDAIVDESSNSPKRELLRTHVGDIRWERIDDNTLTITTPEPFAPLLVHLSEIPIIPHHRLTGEAGIRDDDFNLVPIGTGAYRLDEWVRGVHISLTANDNYFGGSLRNSGLRYVFFSDSDGAAEAFNSGSIDMFYASAEHHERFRSSDSAVVHRYTYYAPVSLAFNHRHPLLQDVTVRRAIAMAIDKQALAAAVTGGQGSVANNQFSPGGPLGAFNDEANVIAHALDPSAANAMLDAAGYMRGPDGIRGREDGTRFSVNLVTYSGFQEYIEAQGQLAVMLREIGIEVVPQSADSATLDQMRRNPLASPDERALELQEWPHPLEFDPDVYHELHSDSFPPRRNAMWFRDPAIDALIERGRSTFDPAERVSIYRQLDVARSEALPSVPLYNAVDAWVVSTRVTGVADSPYFRRYVLTSAADWIKE